MKEYDKLSMRLVQILSKFNNGESVSAQELAQEFNVDTRTIQRDLKERLIFMPIKKEKGRYSLESFALGKLSFKDIQNFATLSGIAELYPKLDQGFIVDLLSHRVNKVLMVKNEGFQKVDYELFKDLSVAILKHKVLSFFYKEKERQIKPYKLVNYKGIWYLLGDENDKLKHFNLDKISKLRIKNENFIPNEKFQEQIQNDPNIWFGENKEVILKLDKNTKQLSNHLYRRICHNKKIAYSNKEYKKFQHFNDNYLRIYISQILKNAVYTKRSFISTQRTPNTTQ